MFLNKILFGLIFTCFLTLGENDPVLNVLHINGTIINKTQNKTISVGDKIAPSDQLEFKTITSSCFLMDNTPQRFIARPREQLVVSASASITSLPKRTAITARSLDLPGTISILNLKDYFGDKNYVFFSGVETVEIDSSWHPPKNEVLIAKYKINEKEITKIVKSSSSTLYFDLFEIFEKDSNGYPQVAPVELYLYNTVNNNLRKTAGFIPFSLNKNSALEELRVIKEFLANSGSKSIIIFNEMSSYLEDVYGRHSKVELRNFLQKELNFFITD